MRIFIALSVLVALLSFTESASAQFGCGIPPIPPIPQIGCSAMQPTCVCDAQGQCHWEFVCIRQ